MARKGGLGKGLNSLIPDDITEEIIEQPKGKVIELDINDVEPNKEQPRKEFDQEKLEALADSIKIHGVIQPILVVKNDDRYIIVAGERRWRASKKAKLKKIPAIICDYDNEKVMEVALIENLQREDLNPIEEAMGYKSLMDSFNMTQEKISERVGKSRSAVANSLRILTLPKEVINYISKGLISTGHAKAILSQKTVELQKQLAEEIINKKLSVREAENYKPKNQSLNEKIKKEEIKDEDLSNYISDLENKISKTLGNKVKIHHKNGKGKIEIDYFSNEDFERILNFLNIQ